MNNDEIPPESFFRSSCMSEEEKKLDSFLAESIVDIVPPQDINDKIYKNVSLSSLARSNSFRYLDWISYALVAASLGLAFLFWYKNINTIDSVETYVGAYEVAQLNNLLENDLNNNQDSIQIIIDASLFSTNLVADSGGLITDLEKVLDFVENNKGEVQ